jgi:nucleotide-binding universal stress UspA family protein
MNLPISKILHPTDFSMASQTALALASSLACANNATLIIAHIFSPTANVVAASPPVAISVANAVEEKERLKRIIPSDPQVKFVHRLLEGSPAQSIVEFAESDSIDLIVMGTHGQTGLTRLLMGSVAEAVVRKAPCPVLTIKESSREPARI